MSSYCFPKAEFRAFAFLFVILVIFLIYTRVKNSEAMTNVNLASHLTKSQLMEKIQDMQEALNRSTKSEQQCQADLQDTKTICSMRNNANTRNNVSNLMNPLTPPERLYPGGRLNYASNDDFQMIGFIHSNESRFPLFGRYKIPGRTEKWEYYTIDESRNRLKIPFKSPNENELMDGDTVFIDILKNSFEVKLYEYQNFRYNPNYI